MSALFHLSNLRSCSHLKPVLMNWMFGVIWLSRRSFPFEQTSLFAYVTVIRVWKSRVHQMTPPEISAWCLRVLMCSNYCVRPVQASARHTVRWMIITYLTEWVREKRWCPARLPDIEDTFQPCCWVANLIKFFVIITSVQWIYAIVCWKHIKSSILRGIQTWHVWDKLHILTILY